MDKEYDNYFGTVKGKYNNVGIVVSERRNNYNHTLLFDISDNGIIRYIKGIDKEEDYKIEEVKNNEQ